MRCLALAEELRDTGYEITFATREQASDLNSFILENRFKLINLKKPQKYQLPRGTADYARWLQIPEKEDAEDFISKMTDIDLVIIDHYGINRNWHELVKKELGCKVMVIDDLVREHNADLIVDQTLNRKHSEYSKLQRCIALTGTKYALLKPGFAVARKKLKHSPKQKNKILITMGGIDQPNASLQVLKALLGMKLEIPTTVLLSERSPNYESVKTFALANPSWVEHVDFVCDMPTFMSKYSIVIGAPGSSSWERACLGIPSILVPLAENQNAIAEELEKADAVKVVKLNDITKDLSYALDGIISCWENYSVNNFELCDGLGIERIIMNINFLLDQLLQLRKATQSDIDQVYEWQCQPETRRYALNKNTPSLIEHRAWMKKKITSDCDYFYIIELSCSKIGKTVSMGVVRLDFTAENTYTISIFIAPEHFGKGVAKFALDKLGELHPTAVINAVVLKDNLISQALFSRAGYQKIDDEHFTRLPVL